MKKITVPIPIHATKKRSYLQKRCWLAISVGLFLGLLWVAFVWAPLFLAYAYSAGHAFVFLDDYRALFLLVHAVFIITTCWWWPAYMRARGKRHRWSATQIRRASDRKWVVMWVLFVLCVLFFYT